MLTEKAKKAVHEVAVVGCFVLAFSCAVEAAIPSAAECKAARAKLAELTSDDYKELKAKTKTNEQVGDALAQYADNEESAAGKFALLQDAFQQYVLGKSVDKAESVYSKAQTVGGVEYALEMARPARSKLSAYATSKNAPAKALKERIMADEKSFQRVGIVKAKLKKAPGDESLCEQLGIEYAAIGDWESALAAFVTAAGEVAKVADWELNGGKGVDYTAATVGAFWWKFADNFPKRRNVEETMRLHAAMWYKLALDKDAFKGNEKTIIEKRVAETEKFEGLTNQSAALAQKRADMLSPIKLVLTKNNFIEFMGCPAGEFTMGRTHNNNSVDQAHQVVITRPFWLTKFQVTRKQWKAFGGDRERAEHDQQLANVFGAENAPVCNLNREDIFDFCRKLSKRFSKQFPSDYICRLPTDAEWEYALKANCTDCDDPYVKAFNGINTTPLIAITSREFQALAKKGGYDIKKLEDWKYMPTDVGQKKPNAWGFFDMIGNGWEYVLDQIDDTKLKPNEFFENGKILKDFTYAEKEKDPLRYADCGEIAVGLCRGCGNQWMPIWLDDAQNHLYTRRLQKVFEREWRMTIRLCIGPDLMKEKGYTAKAKKRQGKGEKLCQW